MQQQQQKEEQVALVAVGRKHALTPIQTHLLTHTMRVGNRQSDVAICLHAFRFPWPPPSRSALSGLLCVSQKESPMVMANL